MDHIESIDTELRVLESIYKNRETIHQRNIAKIAGLSLGMTNAIVKRLAQKGWLKISKVNNRNIHYIVSPDGAEAIAKKSYRYFKRTIKNVVYYKEILVDLVRDIEKKGFRAIVLIGKSDVDFIVEHHCIKIGLGFFKRSERDDNQDFFYLYSEDYRPEPANDSVDKQANFAYLRDILV